MKQRETLANALWGMRWGLYFGVAFSVQALIVVGLTGGPDNFNKSSLFYLIPGYVFFGVAGGAIVGVFRTRTKTALASIFVAFLATWPFAFFLFVLYDTDRSAQAWLVGATVISTIWSVIGGPWFLSYRTERAIRPRRTAK